ncbi:MAG: preprotein translocase subunit SecE [Planctomycetota bacterium]
MALLGWGAYSTYHMLYVSFNWHEELPDPAFDYSVAHPCPDTNALRQYVIETQGWTLVVYRPKPKAAEEATPDGSAPSPASPDGAVSGAPAAGTPRFANGLTPTGVRISITDPLLLAAVADQLRSAARGSTQTQPVQTQPAPPAKDETLVAQTPWQQLVDTVLTVRPNDGPYIRSGAGTGLQISVTHPLRPADRMFIDFPQPYIVPPGFGTCPETGRQLNGIGIPWAIVIAAVMLFVSFWISWKVCFGRWLSTMLIETDQEMHKVAWPTRDRVINSSVVVVFCTLFFAMLLFCADWLLNQLISFLF